MDNNEFVSISNRKVIGIILTILLILLLILGCCFFFIKRKTNPNIYLDTLSNNITTYISNYYNSFETFNKEYLGNASKLTGNIKFKTDVSDLDILNSYSLDYNILTSLNKEEMDISFDLLEDNNSLLNGNFYLIENSFYLEILDLYKQIIKLGDIEENIFIFNNYQNKDIINSFNNLIKYYFESLKLSDFSSQIESLYKVRYKFSITNNNLEQVNNKFQELLKTDKVLKDLLEENKDNFSLNFEVVDIEILVNIFTGEIYEFQSVNETDTLILKKDKNNDNKYLITENDNTHQLVITDNGFTLFLYEAEVLINTIEITTNEKNFLLNITDATNSLNLIIKETSNNTLNLAFNIENKEDNFQIDLNGAINYQDNGYNINILTDIIIEDEKIGSIMTGDGIIKDDLLEEKNLIDYKELNSLEEEEINSIFEKLFQKFENSKFLELLERSSNL